MKTNAYRFEVQVLDYQQFDVADVICELERSKYMSVRVLSGVVKEVDWDDDHPLNKSDTTEAEIDEIFSDAVAVKVR